MAEGHVYAVDYETFYRKESKKHAPFTIESHGLVKFVRDPQFDAYLVSIVGTDGTRIVDNPLKVDWSFARGATLVSHNAAFDHGIQRELFKLGRHPAVEPAVWECTSDLACFFGCPGDLATASRILLGEHVDKSTRDKMSGKRWDEMTDEFKAEVLQYATRDAELSLALWTKWAHLWPERERRISRMTRISGWRGLGVDLEGAKRDAEALIPQMEEELRAIPWVRNKSLSEELLVDEDEGDDDQEYATPLASTALKRQILKDGLTPPAKFNKQDPAYLAWLEAHEHVPYVRAVGRFRSKNMLYQKYATLIFRTHEGRFGYSLKYGGAHTLRDSGGGALNVQNMPSGEMFGVEFRSRIIASPGKVLLAGDLSAIEPRMCAYLAKDKEMLALASSYKDWYEVQARAWGLHKDPEPLKAFPDRRRAIKGLNIGLGYGMWYDTYSKKSGKPLHEAIADVDWWRKQNEAQVNYWHRLFNALYSRPGQDVNLRLLSGRHMHYRSVAREGNSRVSALVKSESAGGKMLRRYFHAGGLMENKVQAESRDVLMNCALLAEDLGFDILLRVHDEILTEVDEDVVDEATRALQAVMETAPEWAPDIPLNSEVGCGMTYAEAK